jgi:hypothetical protein
MQLTTPSPRRLALTSVIALLFGLSVPFTAPAAETKAAGPHPEDELRALETARGEALLKADTTALSRMIADEFVEISRLGQLRTKADNVREIGSGELKLKTVNYSDLTVRVYGDVAVLQGVADNTGMYRGFPFGGKLRYTRVFVRRGGRWQAVAMQHTMIQQ